MTNAKFWFIVTISVLNLGALLINECINGIAHMVGMSQDKNGRIWLQVITALILSCLSQHCHAATGTSISMKGIRKYTSVSLGQGRGCFGSRLLAAFTKARVEEVPLLPCHFSRTYIKLWQSCGSSHGGAVKADPDNGSRGKDLLWIHLTAFKTLWYL